MQYRHVCAVTCGHGTCFTFMLFDVILTMIFTNYGKDKESDHHKCALKAWAESRLVSGRYLKDTFDRTPEGRRALLVDPKCTNRDRHCLLPVENM